MVARAALEALERGARFAGFAQDQRRRGEAVPLASLRASELPRAPTNRATKARPERERSEANVMKEGLPRRETPRVFERRREAQRQCCTSDWISVASVLIGRRSISAASG